MEPTLEELVESLTTSGEPQLNPEKLKQLKKICKSSDEHIKHVYHLLMTQLNQGHAEIRLSAFQVVSELFSRSHLFRTLLISNFQEFLELTVETDYEQPLPPPKEVAQKLKVLAIKAVQEWQEKYGEAYKKLSLGYHFLKQNKKVDFQDVRSRTVAERKREEEKQKRLENIYKEKAKKAKTEMEEMLEDIESCLTEMENCFSLLLPDPDQFTLFSNEGDESAGEPITQPSPKPCLSTPDDEQPCCSKDLPKLSAASSSHEANGEEKVKSPSKESTSDESDDDFEAVEESFIREHGLGSHKYTLDIEISTDMKVSENEDNTDVLNNLMDACKIAKNKYWPAVQSWIQVFTKAGISDDSLKCAIDLKKKLEAAIKKQKEMNIECKTRNGRAVVDSDEEDEEFEEVPEKEGYEPDIPEHLRPEYVKQQKTRLGTCRDQFCTTRAAPAAGPSSPGGAPSDGEFLRLPPTQSSSKVSPPLFPVGSRRRRRPKQKRRDESPGYAFFRSVAPNLNSVPMDKRSRCQSAIMSIIEIFKQDYEYYDVVESINFHHWRATGFTSPQPSYQPPLRPTYGPPGHSTQQYGHHSVAPPAQGQYTVSSQFHEVPEGSGSSSTGPFSQDFFYF
ncbi:UV-stimulated scaffold protein A isoform X3 [Engystomops pustulosus]|uniref:UV-stimulated scaffold protein A isoform X3 n=1 Tax=Engystomops pustulosus TaxID=76066 RepID=UPI003AFA0F64